MQCEKLTLAEDPSWAFLYNSLFVILFSEKR